MIDPSDRDLLKARLATAMEEYDERHGPAVTCWQRFRRNRYRRLFRRRLIDRYSLRHS